MCRHHRGVREGLQASAWTLMRDVDDDTDNSVVVPTSTSMIDMAVAHAHAHQLNRQKQAADDVDFGTMTIVVLAMALFAGLGVLPLYVAKVDATWEGPGLAVACVRHDACRLVRPARGWVEQKRAWDDSAISRKRGKSQGGIARRCALGNRHHGFREAFLLGQRRRRRRRRRRRSQADRQGAQRCGHGKHKGRSWPRTRAERGAE
ncbi:hypothetical protein RI054_30g120420 [Pseudoscourfieldia marina]